MWQNYLTVAFRALAKNKTYAFINLFGLTTGLAACLLLFLYVRHELSYDAWIPGADRAFQLQQWQNGANGEPAGGLRMTSFVSGAMLRKDFPQLDRVVYVRNARPTILQDGEPTVSEHFVYTDGPLFDVLQIPFVRGDPRTALASPGSLVLTESEAAKRFGAADPIGRTLTIVAGDKSTDYRVTGVVRDPRRSHLALSVIARYEPQAVEPPGFLTQWMAKNGWVYARLKPGADIETIVRQMPAWEKRNIPDQTLGGERFNWGENNDWRLVNLRHIHLGTAQDAIMTPGNDRGTIATFVIVGLLILAMAAMNFVNLATARAGQRAREVALRKVLGASRRQLIVQFLGESVLLVALAVVLALATVELALPSLNAFLRTDMTAAYWGTDGMLAPVVILLLLVGGAGGLYPALYLSRFQPAAVLKANKSSADPHGAGRLRNLLVVTQFAVSIGLIICTAIIYAQTDYARTSDPGYRREGLLQIGNVNRSALLPVADTLLHQIRNLEGVEAIGRSTIGVATFGMENMNVTPPGADRSVEFNVYHVDPGFFGTMGIETLAGRGFVEGRATDDHTLQGFPPSPGAETARAARGYNVVLNEMAARQLGYSRPADAIGKTLKADEGDVEAHGQTPVTVIGVVGNSRFRSIRDPLEPMLFAYDRITPSWLLVRYRGSPREVRENIAKLWKRIAPDVPFEAEFADDIVRELYAAEATRGRIFTAFALLAVAIGCLGLYGLAAFTAERRTREIGIRKVLGARTRDIVRLLVWQFSRPVLVANLIAWPAAWWAMRGWLNGFDARIDLGPAPFVAAGGLAMAIAALTVTGQAWRVARTRPVEALRYE